jgi:hypothetical protein
MSCGLHRSSCDIFGRVSKAVERGHLLVCVRRARKELMNVDMLDLEGEES